MTAHHHSSDQLYQPEGVTTSDSEEEIRAGQNCYKIIRLETVYETANVFESI